MTGKIALIDGNALVHRAFHALPLLTSPGGELVNAVYGVASMLLKVFKEVPLEYAAAAFDTAAPTYRHVEFQAYKAQRGPAPEGLHEQFGRVYQLLDALGVPGYRLDGYEADDLLGTLARQACDQGVDVVIVTGDTDTLQLVGPGVTVLTPGRKGFSDTVLYDELAVRERYGVEPGQLVDLKALKGDPSDNIPGVPGVGEKTASKLVAKCGNLEGIYDALDSVSAKLKSLLEENREAAFFSRRLVTIDTQAPVTLEIEKCRLGRHDRARLVKLFRELGFRTLLDRLPKNGFHNGGDALPTPPEIGAEQLALFPSDPAQLSVGAVEPAESQATAAPPSGLPLPPRVGEGGRGDEGAPARRVVVVSDREQLESLLATLRAASVFALDTETTGLDPMSVDLVGLSFATEPGTAYYVPVGHRPLAERYFGLPSSAASMLAKPEDEPSQLPLQEVLDALRPVLEDETRPKCAHNANFDMLVLARHGIDVRGMEFDSMIAAYLLESGQRALGLKDLAYNRFKEEMESYADLAGKGKGALTLDQLPIWRVARYSGADAEVTLRLKADLRPELGSAELDRLFREVEMPLVPAIVRMERTGVALNVDYLKRLSTELYDRTRELGVAICDTAGHNFNISSTQQLATVLFKELKLGTARRTKTGFSTDADVLEDLREAHPIVDMVLEHRQLTKLKSTYVDALPLLVNPRTGRVHTSFNQTGASTGRLSSSDPNLQNIPIRTEMGRRVRKAFAAPDPSTVLLSVDYSQIELRVLAHMTGDPALVEAFHRGEDIHAATAAQVHGIPIGEVTSEQRRIAKTVNFGVLYGMGSLGLARDTGLSRQEAASFIESYFARYSSVKSFFAELIRKAEESGYVSTLLGRRRYIPEIRSAHRGLRQAAERMVINMPIQGTAADIMKIAMVNLDRFIMQRALRSRMILTVHDELVFECPSDELDSFAPEVRRIMESVIPLQVPLKADAKVGPNWDQMVPLPQ